MSGKTSQRRCSCNIRARSRNHCCRGQAVSITYSECVSILALGNRHANPIISARYYIVTLGLSGSTTFFHIIS